MSAANRELFAIENAESIAWETEVESRGLRWTDNEATASPLFDACEDTLYERDAVRSALGALRFEGNRTEYGRILRG